MENKFYTPELEEFCKGFEYEQLGPKNEWVKCTWDFHQFSEGRFLSLLDAPAWVRVKLLDKDDIESLGFKQDESLKHIFRTDKIKLEFNHVTQHITLVNRAVNYFTEVEDVRFSGEIKNKSELKRILKQVQL